MYLLYKFFQKYAFRFYFILYLFNILLTTPIFTSFPDKLLSQKIPSWSSNKYLNLDNLQFESLNAPKCIKFPHQLLNKENEINLDNAISFFKVFEIILQNHHLNNMNLNIPISYFKFKKIILNFLTKNEKYN